MASRRVWLPATTCAGLAPVDPQLVRDVDLVVTLGREAHLDPVAGTRFENWDTDELSERGIDGIERMRLVRNDIAARVTELTDRLHP